MYYIPPPKKQKERKRVTARLRLRAGKASNYIAHAPAAIKPGDLVIICCRVSRYAQKHRGNLSDQEENLKQRAKNLGAIVVETFPYVGPGYDPYWLALAAENAKHLGAKLFAESTDRFIRHPDYHSQKNPNAQARDCDLQDLGRWTSGVELVTDLPPDATPKEVRSYQRKRGQAAKGNKGGRPRANNEQRKLRDAVVRLWRKLPPQSRGKGVVKH